MIETQQTDAAASSTAPQQNFAIPTDPKANLEWRTTGKLPGDDAAKESTPKEASTPSNKNASADDDSAETAAASATASKQDKAKPLSAAATRLNEILADLKKAGLNPEELKTFKREAQAAKTEEPAPAKAAPEKTVNPQGPEKPVKPTWQDTKADGSKKWASWEDFDAAKDDYHDAMAEYRANVAVLEDRRARADEAQQKIVAQKITEAKARYGDQTEATIGEATRSILGDKDVSLVVRQMLDESPLLVDVMYVLGSKPDELASFVELAKKDPGKAIRKVALLEQLVEQELAKGATAGKGADAAAAEAEAAERGEDGKFVSQPPAKKKTPAPPPAEELNTRGSAAPDPIAAAVRNHDFRSFKDAEDRAEIARRRGA